MICEEKNPMFVPVQGAGKCSHCGKQMIEHVIGPDGARYHVHSWSTLGVHCSENMCKDNHGPGKCRPLTGEERWERMRRIERTQYQGQRRKGC